MKILHILKNTPDETATRIMEEHANSCESTVVDLKQDKDYARIITLIESSDSVICW